MPCLLQALALIGLFLLPVQVRAGTEHPHPHSLFQLLLDASDGVIDHHAGTEEDAHFQDQLDAGTTSSAHHPDAPDFGDLIQASGGLALLATLLIVLLLPAAGSAPIWPPSCRWQGRIPTMEPPPPRVAGN
jgi:hypothetical protein